MNQKAYRVNFHIYHNGQVYQGLQVQLSHADQQACYTCVPASNMKGYCYRHRFCQTRNLYSILQDESTTKDNSRFHQFNTESNYLVFHPHVCNNLSSAYKEHTHTSCVFSQQDTSRGPVHTAWQTNQTILKCELKKMHHDGTATWELLLKKKKLFQNGISILGSNTYSQNHPKHARLTLLFKYICFEQEKDLKYNSNHPMSYQTGFQLQSQYGLFGQTWI